MTLGEESYSPNIKCMGFLTEFSKTIDTEFLMTNSNITK